MPKRDIVSFHLLYFIINVQTPVIYKSHYSHSEMDKLANTLATFDPER